MMTSQIELRSVRTPIQAEFTSFIEIQLDPSRAQSWLTFLETTQHNTTPLTEFIEKLDEACWLAAWKREYVRFDVDLADIPVVLSYVAGIEDSKHFDIQEDILQCLSKL